ncbi:unnamed protein product [Ixodes hexagonus]
MVNCAVIGCSNRSKRKTDGENFRRFGFYVLPNVVHGQCEKTAEVTSRRRAEWLRRIRRADINKDAKHYRVCSEHFVKGHPSYYMAEADEDWAPSLKLGYKRAEKDSRERSFARPTLRSLRDIRARHEPKVKMCDGVDPYTLRITRRRDGHTDTTADTDLVPATTHVNIITYLDAETTTDLTMACIAALESDNIRLSSELQLANEKLRRHQMHEESFKNDDSRVRFYTGLPTFPVLLAVFQLLEAYVPHTSRNALPKFQEMVVTLMRLRLGMPLQDIAYRFQVSQATVTKIVDKWLGVMHVRLGGLVRWPEREDLRRSMPASFRAAFGVKVAVILDCFEVFIDRPSSLVSRALTWSQYKHHNTVKYLSGIAPQGVITFISKGWGGRTSDKELTETCGILENLLPGDSALADRGFTIADSVGLFCARLEIPAFTRGRAQLSAYEVAKTRTLANVRIHEERVISLLRNKYRILSTTIPVELISTPAGDSVPDLDKVVTVCAALTNLCKSVVSPN